MHCILTNLYLSLFNCLTKGGNKFDAYLCNFTKTRKLKIKNVDVQFRLYTYFIL